MNTDSTPSLVNLAPEEIEARQRAVMRSVYLWMTVGLFITAFVAFTVLSVPQLLFFLAQRGVFYGLLITEFVLVLALAWAFNRMPVLLALMAFVVYAALNGATMSLILALYTLSSVTAAFVASACLFGAMSIVGYTTKIDLTRLGGFLLMALLGLIIASVINLFFASSAFDWILTFVGILIFIGLTAYDTQRIKTMTLAAIAQGETAVEERIGILGALVLYLDFVNLFLRILRLFGKRR